MSWSDDELVRRCQEELPYRTEAFEALLRRYEPLVYGFCRRYLGSPEEAEDAAQEIFLRVFHGIRRFDRRASWRTWLFRIAANRCAARYGKRRREAGWEARYRASRPRPGPASPPGEPVRAALAELDEDDRTVLLLRHAAGLSLRELAAALDVELSAAKMRLYRAETRFRAAYGRRGGA